MGNALWITLIGMGLVFGAILLLWGLMALIVRLAKDPAPELGTPVEEISQPEPEQSPDLDLLRERKRRAAAAAYVAALSIRKVKGAAARPALVSAWQAVQRAGLVSQRANARKKVS